ncbi:MAG TPA: hypothetical protein VGC41_27580 [Kofleriaceae bacterium]
MSKEGKQIEEARRLYAAAIGTSKEADARQYLERVVDEVRRGRRS